MVSSILPIIHSNGLFFIANVCLTEIIDRSICSKVHFKARMENSITPAKRFVALIHLAAILVLAGCRNWVRPVECVLVSNCRCSLLPQALYNAIPITHWLFLAYLTVQSLLVSRSLSLSLFHSHSHSNTYTYTQQRVEILHNHR